MRDQLRTLADTGVGAVALHSMQEDDEAAASIDAVASGRARLLYAAPERLAQEGTQHLLRSIRIKLFAIDEAHCVSHWGHEFRPDYRALGDIARKLGAPPTLAVTATAGPRTRDDIARTLFSRPAEIFLRSFARPNLSLDFAQKRAGLRQIVEFARKGRAPGKESGIIYCNSRNKTDALARELSRLGFDALPYHAGLDAHTRSESQDAFFARKGAVMVATIAFGMGVDKPDVRFIVHADLPTSIEGYYQEIGRAGRDGAPARALTLFSPAELALRWRIPQTAQENEAAAGDYARRQAMARLAAAPGCRFQRLLAEFGEDSAPCGKCDHCRGGPLAWPRRLSSLALGWRAEFASGFANRGDLPDVEETVPQIAAAPVILSNSAGRAAAHGRPGAPAARAGGRTTSYRKTAWASAARGRLRTSAARARARKTGQRRRSAAQRDRRRGGAAAGDRRSPLRRRQGFRLAPQHCS